MRSRATNALQIAVLITGLCYLLIGAVFFVSPFAFGRILGVDVIEDWKSVIHADVFLSYLYYFSRAFAAMIFSAGCAMVLPLFDPLKYRFLVYFTGVMFSAFASLLLIISGVRIKYTALMLFGVLFLCLFLLNAVGLAVSHRGAKAGVE